MDSPEISDMADRFVRLAADQQRLEAITRDLPQDVQVVIRMFTNRCSISEMVYVLSWYAEYTDPVLPSAGAAGKAELRLIEILPQLRRILDQAEGT